MIILKVIGLFCCGIFIWAGLEHIMYINHKDDEED